MEERVSVRANLSLSREAKALYDQLPHGSRRILLSQFMERYTALRERYGALALHALLQGNFTIELDLEDDARRVLDAAGNEEDTGAGHFISGDGEGGEAGVDRADKATKGKDAA